MVWVLPATGYGVHGYGCGVGKPNPRYTRAKPYPYTLPSLTSGPRLARKAAPPAVSSGELQSILSARMATIYKVFYCKKVWQEKGRDGG